MEELGRDVGNFSMNEEDQKVLVGYFWFGLEGVKWYGVGFEEEKNGGCGCN